MRRGLAGMVLMIAILGTAPAAIGCRPDTFLEELQSGQQLIVARTAAIEWMGPNGWTPLPYETADDGIWRIPASIAAHAGGDSSFLLDKSVELRVTLVPEQWLLPRGLAPSQLPHPTSLTFTEDAVTAELRWQSRFLATLYNNLNGPSVRQIASDCNTPLCNEREIEAAIRILPLLSASELDHRRIADWAVEVALDDDIWAEGLSTLRDSSLPDPEAPGKPDGPSREISLMHFVSPSAIDRLVRTARKERGLTPRFVSSLELPYPTFPRELVTDAIERITTELSQNEYRWEVSSAIRALLPATRPKCLPEDHAAEAEGTVCPPEPVMRLMDLSFSFIEDKSRHWALERHTWAEFVRSGRLGQVNVPADWWRPDIVAEAKEFLAEVQRVQEELEEELAEP